MFLMLMYHNVHIQNHVYFLKQTITARTCVILREEEIWIKKRGNYSECLKQHIDLVGESKKVVSALNTKAYKTFLQLLNYNTK